MVLVAVGDQEFRAVLDDSPSVEELIRLMPFTCFMQELNGNEKYYFLPHPIPVDARKTEDIRTGDLMLYGSDCLVLFYEDFTSSYSYTRLGRIEDVTGLSDVLGGGSVTATFSIG